MISAESRRRIKNNLHIANKAFLERERERERERVIESYCLISIISIYFFIL